MKHIYLSNTYNNDYLTTHKGLIFKKDRSKQRPVEYNEEAVAKDPELNFLIKQGTLVIEDDKKQKEQVIKDTPKKSIKETKTSTSTEKNEEVLQEVAEKPVDKKTLSEEEPADDSKQ